MKTSMHVRPLLIGSLAAIVVMGAASAALAQARSYPRMSNCLTPQSALQQQQCSTERQPFYTSDDHILPHPEAQDGRLEMNLDNGGGGTQTPVVPNTTGAPVTSGGADGFGPSVD
jgi:hypothetical protein